MNNRIYNNAINHTGYMNDHSNGPFPNDPFYLKNDFEFNQRLAQQRADDREHLRKDQGAVDERLKDVDYQLKY